MGSRSDLKQVQRKHGGLRVRLVNQAFFFIYFFFYLFSLFVMCVSVFQKCLLI